LAKHFKFGGKKARFGGKCLICRDNLFEIAPKRTKVIIQKFILHPVVPMAAI